MTDMSADLQPHFTFTRMHQDVAMQMSKALIKTLNIDHGQQVLVQIVLVKPSTPMGPIFSALVLCATLPKDHYLTISF